MRRYPLVRLIVGLSLGFLGATATFVIVDRYGNEADLQPAYDVLGDPDYDGYCDDQPGGLESTLIRRSVDGRRCVGLTNGLFTVVDTDVDVVCEWKFGAGARADVVDEADPDGARCIRPADG